MIVHDEAPQVASELPSAPTCCHYWIIETAHGPISRGECQVCHEVRDFKNSVFDMERESKDSRSRKDSQPEGNNRQEVVSQASLEIGQEIGLELGVAPEDTLDPGEAESPEAEPEVVPETAIEEPEFAGISED